MLSFFHLHFRIGLRCSSWFSESFSFWFSFSFFSFSVLLVLFFQVLLFCLTFSSFLSSFPFLSCSPFLSSFPFLSCTHFCPCPRFTLSVFCVFSLIRAFLVLNFNQSIAQLLCQRMLRGRGTFFSASLCFFILIFQHNGK